ncbi:MAG TPA: adenylate/guanylate cyclase domain-containing protein [Burkholderiales bacterium]|nr:adenylate/guanylate cyclase domain-containing protein [Burkholderiales bacterium]
MPDPAQANSNSVGILGRLTQSVISPSDSEDERLRKTLLLFACGLMNLAAGFWLMIYWTMGMRLPTTIPLGYQLVSALTLMIYLKTKNFAFFRFTQISLLLFVPFVIQWSIGNFISSSGIVLLALLAPVGAMVFQGVRESIPWFVAYVVLTAVSGVFDYYLAAGVVSGVPMKIIPVFFVLNFTILSTIVYLLIRFFVLKKEMFQTELGEKNRLLQVEQDKSERLLLNILPKHVAERLKHDEKIIADGLADVTVMFADIVDFTRLAERMLPRHMVDLLNKVFSNFDWLTDKYGLEKIKTIGDAYMVAGGLGDNQTDYVEAVANMALEIRELVRRHPAFSRQNLDIHIGIATGPVVAGVIGSKRFIYDLWGDTVNIASRITSEAGSGTIQVDETTYRRLRDRFSFDAPQTIELKGKGITTVYPLTA